MLLNPHYTYLCLNLLTIAFPLAAVKDSRFSYYRSLQYLWPALIFTGACFIAADVWFTRQGIWSFNPEYIIGIYWLDLPVEEWLFFACIPFSCVFIYECIGCFMPHAGSGNTAYYIAWMLVGLLGMVAFLFGERTYTSLKLGGAALAIVLHLMVFNRQVIGRFLVAYLFTLLPFLLVNGVLTYLPVVYYNDSENLGIRISDFTGIPFFNIPIEDTVYSLFLMLVNVSIFEWLRMRDRQKTVL
ncbi:MAG: lycopene cyclase domain-containing protein [Bacteroidota bacterium]